VIFKICGIKNTKIINCCEENNVNFFGMIFYEKSPRNISIDQAIKLCNFSKQLNIKAVGVFVNKDFNELSRYISKLDLKIIQLHGNENQQYINNIKKKFNIKIIKKISIANKEDYLTTNNLKNIDYLLFDYKPSKNEFPGGNAKTFDWALLKDIKPKIPWFLSGGINKANINNINNFINPDGIDLSSGVEEAPGMKSESKIKNLFKHYYGK